MPALVPVGSATARGRLVRLSGGLPFVYQTHTTSRGFRALVWPGFGMKSCSIGSYVCLCQDLQCLSDPSL